MEDSELYINRKMLYEPLISCLQLKKVVEGYSETAFGNFFIELSSKEFSLRYNMDRSYLTVEIRSNSSYNKWYDVSFLMNFVLKSDKINVADGLDNLTRIHKLNDFLKNNFELVNDLLNKDNFQNTYNKLEELLT